MMNANSQMNTGQVQGVWSNPNGNYYIKQENNVMGKVLATLLVGVLFVGTTAGAFVYGQNLSKMESDDKPMVKGVDAYAGYQAIFLQNGQIYFGKITERDEYQVKLNEAYYLKVNDNISNPATETDSQPLDLTLEKRENALHGPDGRMEVSWSQILFIENLKPDSQVVKAIETFNREQTK